MLFCQHHWCPHCIASHPWCDMMCQCPRCVMSPLCRCPRHVSCCVVLCPHRVLSLSCRVCVLIVSRVVSMSPSSMWCDVTLSCPITFPSSCCVVSSLLSEREGDGGGHECTGAWTHVLCACRRADVGRRERWWSSADANGCRYLLTCVPGTGVIVAGIGCPCHWCGRGCWWIMLMWG